MTKNVKELGQVFTPNFIVSQMLTLIKNSGTILEPSAGDGAFLKEIPKAIGIEIDKRFIDTRVLNIDFFDYSTDNKFDTIIGNPPYVRYQDIDKSTKSKLDKKFFDERSNLYLFFIKKSIEHLNKNGELIFITPREFLKSTSSIKLNQFLFENGTITDLIDLGDKKIFKGFSPNCIIWRFEKDNYSRVVNIAKNFIFSDGQLLFVDNDYPIKFKDIFFVKVGAVSGFDKIFANEEYGNADFVCSQTIKTGKTKKMIYNYKNEYLENYKDILLKRKIKKFDESNWWLWGRDFYKSFKKRIYVNCKTRDKKPFFTHNSTYYDGSILAIFPNNQQLDCDEVAQELNRVNWNELGFVCDGRFIFSQKSLEETLLPLEFAKYVQKNSLI
jgi:adenine-specific DNA-methyltransferase